jgi:hypothetical protein
MPGALTAPRTRPPEPADARIVDGALIEVVARINVMVAALVVVWRPAPISRLALPSLLQGLAVAASKVLVMREVGGPTPVVPSGQLPTATQAAGVQAMLYPGTERIPAGPWADDLGSENLEALLTHLNRLLHRLRTAGYISQT